MIRFELPVTVNDLEIRCHYLGDTLQTAAVKYIYVERTPYKFSITQAEEIMDANRSYSFNNTVTNAQIYRYVTALKGCIYGQTGIYFQGEGVARVNDIYFVSGRYEITILADHPEQLNIENSEGWLIPIRQLQDRVVFEILVRENQFDSLTIRPNNPDCSFTVKGLRIDYMGGNY
jgi:hypothetical protein